MPASFSSIDINPNVWRFLGFGSGIVGFICFALGTSFQNLFGQWNLVKVLVYSSLTFLFSAMTLFVNRIHHSFQWLFWLKPQLGFWVLVLTSLYSYYDDRSTQGETEETGFRSILNLISFAAFALMSWSMSKQVNLRFEVGITNFFLGCLEVKVMKMSMKASVVVGAICLVFMSIRSCLYIGRRGQVRRSGDNDELDDDGLHEELSPVLSYLPLSLRPYPSVSTLRRRPVNLESSSLLNPPPPALQPDHMNSMSGEYRCCGSA